MGRCSGDTAFRGRPSRTGLVSRGMTSSGPKGRPSASRSSDKATEAGLYSTPNGLTHTSIPASAILLPISAEKHEPRERVILFLSIFMDANVRIISSKEKTNEKSELILGQVPLLEVKVKVKVKNKDGNYTGEVRSIYMEQFEEYLDHYDPLEHTQSQMKFDGLQWGYSGNKILRICKSTDRGNAGEWYQEPQNNYTDGYHYSAWLMDKQNAGDNKMTLNDIPDNAVEYCFNRNKRTKDGDIPVEFELVHRLVQDDYAIEQENKSKWFLPGISEMEEALSQYYPQFSEFQNYFYWSSSAGKKRTGIVWPYSYEQDIKSARATKILLNPLDIDGDGEKDYYAISDWDDDYVPGGNRGKASRSEVFRIRAFRIDLDPYEY